MLRIDDVLITEMSFMAKGMQKVFAIFKMRIKKAHCDAFACESFSLSCNRHNKKNTVQSDQRHL